jgi:hypothetical protein
MAIDKGLPMPPFNEVVLSCGALLAAFSKLAEDKGEPADRLLTQLERAEKLHSQLSPEDKERTQELVAHAFDGYATAVCVARESVLQQVFDAMLTLDRQLAGLPSYRINWEAVENVKSPMRRILNDTLQTVRKMKRLARGLELRQQIGNLENQTTETLELLGRIGHSRW